MPVAAMTFSMIAAVALVLLVRAVLPSAPALSQARRPDRSVAAGVLLPSGQPLAVWVGVRILRSATGALRARPQDLRILDISPAAHIGRQALYALGALVFPAFLTALMTAVGAPPPVAMPVIGSLFFAALVWLLVDYDVRKQAGLAREEFRQAAASFLDRAALTRQSSAGASDALVRTAAVGDSPACVRIRTAVEEARLSGETTWAALAALGRDIGVDELAGPADTLALAGEEGATVTTTLQGQARVLRNAITTDAKAAANRASEKMVLPVTGLAFLFLLFLGIPAFTRVMGS
ncbi:type II secretion system F family protein [Streptomyces xiamenensis]|uniref:type II secretion system F family protein n=1 Tax=Streptomyces xiamenensis TaxID=408015 RepID=UPI0035E34222